ncbi:MAG: hypothetical protein AAFX99_32360, partial [Myxococcota bacterium]
IATYIHLGCLALLVPEELDAIRVSILDEARMERSAGVLELVRCPEEELTMLPQTLELVSIDGPVWVVAQGLSNGIEVARFERRAQDGTGLEIELGLTRDCLGASCAVGQTCIDGTCVIVPFDSEEVVDLCVGTAPEPTTTETTPLCPESDVGAGGDTADAGSDADMAEDDDEEN